MTEAVIVSTARSAIARAGKGSFVGLRPDDLAAAIIQSALDKIPSLDPRLVDDMYVGAWEQSGEQSENIARRIAVQLGWDSVPAATVNRACASSVQTTRMAANAIKAGDGSIFISAGVECVSRYSQSGGVGAGDAQFHNRRFARAQERSSRIAETNEIWSDPRDFGALPDIYLTMGQTAENIATYRGISRAEQDEFAARSQQLAEVAIREGFYAREITSVTLEDGSVVKADDGPRFGTTADSLSALRPAFRENGTVTAGNACPLNDGAAALVLMSNHKATELGLEPIARVVSTAVSGLSPEIMGLGPIEASQQALEKAGLSIDDIDLVEINEAFAVQVIASYRDLNIDIDKLNVAGGGIALGHPFGATGARITTTLLHLLQERDGQFGLETMCVGGGQGMAIVFERI